MKKRLFFLLLSLILLFSVYGNQTNYSFSSREVQTLLLLARLTGTALPDMTYPITTENINNMLDRINTGRLNDVAMQLYSQLESDINKPKSVMFSDGAGFNISTPLTVVEAWNDDGLLPFNDRKPLLALNTDIMISPDFAAGVDFDLRAESYNFESIGDKIRLHYPLSVLQDLTHDFPTRAYGSAGNSFLNLTIGRGKLSAGNGVTGNLEIGENLLYQDYAKFSIMSGPISYDFTILAYDNPQSETSALRFNFQDYFKSAYIHRFSTVFADRFTVSLYEGAMVYGNILSDPRTLNPFMMIHNTFTYDNGNVNNFFGGEINTALPWGLSLNIQGFLDQLKLKDETDDSGEPAFAALANIKGTWIAGEGILSAYAEFVYSSKYNYLKEESNPFASGSAASPYYQTDLIAVNKWFPTGLEQNYIGYKYGSDVKVLGLGTRYLYKNHEFSLDFMYRMKGEFGIGSGETRAIKAISDSKPDEKTFSIFIGSKGSVIDGIDYHFKLGYVNSLNYQHVTNSTNPNKFQFVIGFTVDPLDLIFPAYH